MVKKKQKTLATQEEISLLINSDCTSRYKRLLDLLESFKEDRKPIYLEDIEDLKYTDNETYSILVYSFKELVNEGSSEWKQLGYIDSDNNICELCGNTRLEHNFKIKNIKNGNELIVGSSCIGKFPKMNSNGVDIKKEIKNAKIIERKNMFNNKYENTEDLMDSWKRYYIEFPVLLPKYIDDEFNTLFKDSSNFYENFIYDKIALKELDDFNKYIDKFNILKDKSYSFYKLNKNSKYICDIKIIQWLNNKNYRNLRKQIINNNGFIDENISKGIYTIHFINKFKDKINNYFTINGFSVKCLNEYLIKITYKTTEGIEIELALNLKEFMVYFSKIFFGNVLNNEINYIISTFNFAWNEDNLNNFIDLLNIRMKETQYYFKLIYKEGILNEFIKVERGKNYFVELKGSTFIKNTKLNLNKTIKDSSSNISSILSSVNKWKNKKEETQKYNKEEILAAMRN